MTIEDLEFSQDILNEIVFREFQTSGNISLYKKMWRDGFKQAVQDFEVQKSNLLERINKHINGEEKHGK